MSAGWLLAQVPALVLLAGAAMVLAGLGLLLVRGAAGLGGVLAVQGAALAVALLGLAVERGSWGLLGLAGLTLAGKAVALPRAGAWLSQRLDAPRRVPGGLAVVGVAVAGLVLAAGGHASTAPPPAEALALAVFALGAVGLAGRRDLAGQAAGAVGLESGLVLLVAASGAPAWLGLASLMLPGAVGLAVLRRVLAPGDDGTRGAA